jgi:hypothetical protein
MAEGRQMSGGKISNFVLELLGRRSAAAQE